LNPVALPWAAFKLMTPIVKGGTSSEKELFGL